MFLVSIQAFGEIGIKIKTASAVTDIPKGLGQRFAIVAHLQLGQRLLTVADALGNSTQYHGASRAVHVWPRPLIEGVACSLHRQVDVGSGGSGNLGDRCLAARIERIEGPTFDRIYPLAIDVKLSIGIHD
ncbi:hypothetical protein D3C77_362400 [compost metagenome]